MREASQEFLDRARAAVESGTDEEVDALYREASRHIPIRKRFVDVLTAIVSNPDFDARSAAFGLGMGITAAHLHPEWGRACYLELLPTDEAREEAEARVRKLVDLLPMVVEQEAQT